MKFSNLLVGFFINEISAISLRQYEAKKDNDEEGVSKSMKDIVKVLEKHVSKEDLKIGVLQAEKMLNHEGEKTEKSEKPKKSKKIVENKAAEPEQKHEKIYEEEKPTESHQPHNLAHHSSAAKPAAQKEAAPKEDLQAELARNKAEAASAMEKAAEISQKIAEKSAPAQQTLKSEAVSRVANRENDIVKETFAPTKAAATPAEPVEAPPAKAAVEAAPVKAAPEAAPAKAAATEDAPKAPHHHVTFEEKMKHKQELRTLEAEENKKETIGILKRLNDEIDTIYKPKEHKNHDQKAEKPAVSEQTTKDLVKEITKEALPAQAKPEEAAKPVEAAKPAEAAHVAAPVPAAAQPAPTQAPVSTKPVEAPPAQAPIEYKTSSREFPEASPEPQVLRASAPTPEPKVEDKEKPSEYFPFPAKASDKEETDTTVAHAESEKHSVDSARPDFNKAVSGAEEPTGSFHGNNNRNFSEDD